jgi:hypothetical protein
MGVGCSQAIASPAIDNKNKKRDSKVMYLDQHVVISELSQVIESKATFFSTKVTKAAQRTQSWMLTTLCVPCAYSYIRDDTDMPVN